MTRVGLIRDYSIVTLNTLQEFHVVKNCRLGNNSKSEHYIQQMDHSKKQKKKCTNLLGWTWVFKVYLEKQLFSYTHLAPYHA